jgi:hypothetical protein
MRTHIRESQDGIAESRKSVEFYPLSEREHLCDRTAHVLKRATFLEISARDFSSKC